MVHGSSSRAREARFQFTRIHAALLVAGLLGSGEAFAQATQTWTGAASFNLTGANWGGAYIGGRRWAFNGAGASSPLIATLTSPAATDPFQINVSSGSYTINGTVATPLDFIQNNGLGTTGNDHIVTSGSGSLTINVPLVYDQPAGRSIYVNAGGGTVTLAGALGSNATGFGGSSTAWGLVKLGSGQLVLSATNNNYTGPTTVNAGLLTVNGTITSTATVNSGGSLGGTGTVNGIVVNSGGSLAPGNSIGTINVNGNVTFNSGSTYTVEVNPQGQADKTVATGTATINGGTVSVQAASGTYNASTTYTILTANGGRTGTFSSVTSNFAFLTPSLTYDANNVFLVLVNNGSGFLSTAGTPNQRSVAANLDANSASATGDFATVTGALNGLTAAQSRNAYDMLSGVVHPAAPFAARTMVGAFGRLLARRANGVQTGREGTGLAQGGAEPTLVAVSESADVRSDAPMMLLAQAGSASGLSSAGGNSGLGRGFWIRAQGLDHRYNGDGNAPGQGLSSTGVAMGIDSRISADLVVGLAGSYDRASLGTSGNADNGRIRDTKIGAYASWAQGPWTYTGQVHYATDDVATTRYMNFGTINRSATASYRMHQWYAQGEAAYRIPMGRASISPLVGFEVSSLRRDGFTESGAGSVNLAVDGRTTNSLSSNVGARYALPFDAQDSSKGAFEARAAWNHEFRDVNPTMVARFTGAPVASTFTIVGVSQKRDALVLGAGASGSATKQLSVFGDYNLEARGNQKTQTLVAGLRYWF